MNTMDTTKEISSYANGNTSVKIFSDGTKIREFSGQPAIIHPESIDVKITDYCDMGCAYCHESSTLQGKHADLNKLMLVLDDLPAGVELAIGGGNPLSHSDLIPFLLACKMKGFICNITVNQGHLKMFQDLLSSIISDRLVYGVGISITSANYKYLSPILDITDNVVYHVIAGVNNITVIDSLMDIGKYCKVLVLGYKYFGFGVGHYNDDIQISLKQWRKQIRNYVGKCTLSFDNLAIDQLNIKRLFTKDGWEKFYMGDDFCFTMYIDAVKQQYAPTSRSKERRSFADYSLLSYFQKFSNS
jgi:hypothetical protein